MKNGQIAEVSSPKKHTWDYTSAFVISFDPFNVGLVMVMILDPLIWAPIDDGGSGSGMWVSIDGGGSGLVHSSLQTIGSSSWFVMPEILHGYCLNDFENWVFSLADGES